MADPVGFPGPLRRATEPVAEGRVAAVQELLALLEQRHRLVLQHMSDILVLLDAEGQLSYASASAFKLAGFPDQIPALREALDAGPEAGDPDAVVGHLARILSTPGHHDAVRIRLRTRDGRVRRFEVVAENLMDDPTLSGVILLLRDVTEQQYAERMLAAQVRVLEMVARGEDLGTTLDVLARSLEDELIGTRCAIRLADDVQVQDVQMPQAGTAGAWGLPDGYVTLLTHPVHSPRNGKRLGTVELYRSRLDLPDELTAEQVGRVGHLAGIALDRAGLEARLSHQATHDELTDLPNRTLLVDRLGLALSRRRGPGLPETVVLFIDLDRFKVVNDSLGHDVGDQLLVGVAERLRRSVRSSDTVSRFGGDEFVVIAEEADPQLGPIDLAQRVLRAVEEPLVINGRPVSTSASIGVVVAGGYTTATSLLRDADTAMYRAKQAGGNRFELFDRSMRARAVERMELEAAIRRGLERGEFSVVYQPVVDLTDPLRAVVGAEALVRWKHPEKGELEPAAFIDVAEETGLSVPLGEFVLRTAAHAVGSWATPTRDAPPVLSVNVSLRQLGAPGLAEAVAAAMAAASPWTLFLELTESTLLDDSARAQGLIDSLAAVGAELSIDDFGTGYSSLSDLTRLPVSTLKIDRSFVAGLGAGVDARSGAEAVAGVIIGLAERLGLRVIAEGVETAEQEAALRGMGCRYAQGMLFHPPLAADRVKELMEAS